MKDFEIWARVKGVMAPVRLGEYYTRSDAEEATRWLELGGCVYDTDVRQLATLDLGAENQEQRAVIV